MVRRPTPCPRWGNKLMDLVGPRPRRRGPPTDLLAVRRCDGTALVLAILRGRLDETLSFAGVLALAVILGRFAGRLSLAAVGTDALHLVGARARLGACIHGTGDQQHRHRTGDQSILRVHFFLLLRSGLVVALMSAARKRFHTSLSGPAVHSHSKREEHARVEGRGSLEPWCDSKRCTLFDPEGSSALSDTYDFD